MVVLLFLSSGISFGQSAADSDPQFEKLAKDLYPKAKQEGALVLYTIWDVEHIRSILAGFNKRFPGINTTYWQETRSEIVTRTLTEFQGDQKTADVILSEGAPVVLRAAGAIEPYNTVQASSLLLHDPTLPTVSLQIMALSYKLKSEELPKSWEDVVNPKYKSVVTLDDPVRAGNSDHQQGVFRRSAQVAGRQCQAGLGKLIDIAFVQADIFLVRVSSFDNTDPPRHRAEYQNTDRKSFKWPTQSSARMSLNGSIAKSLPS